MLKETTGPYSQGRALASGSPPLKGRQAQHGQWPWLACPSGCLAGGGQHLLALFFIYLFIYLII